MSTNELVRCYECKWLGAMSEATVSREHPEEFDGTVYQTTYQVEGCPGCDNDNAMFETLGYLMTDKPDGA